MDLLDRTCSYRSGKSCHDEFSCEYRVQYHKKYMKFSLGCCTYHLRGVVKVVSKQREKFGLNVIKVTFGVHRCDGATAKPNTF